MQERDNDRWSAPAAERNKGPVLAQLERVLPDSGLVLEIASGTGQHVSHFAKALPKLGWQPSEKDAALRQSVRSWITHEKLDNVRAPLDLDVCRLPWPIAHADAIICINLIHIAPWEATHALFAGAKAVLGQNGVLFLYGPYRRFGRHTAPSNEAFDSQLRAMDPAWGLRDLEAVTDLAGAAGFALSEVIEMRANNFSVVFKCRVPRQRQLNDL